MSKRNDKIREKVGQHITIYKRGRKYYADIFFNGSRERRALGTNNLKAAKQAALGIDADLQRGNRPQKIERITIAEAIENYLAYASSERRRPKTIEKYTSALRCFQEDANSQGIHHLDQVGLMVLEKYRARLRKKGYSESTVEQRTILVKQLSKWAHARKLILSYELEAVKQKKPRPAPQPCYTLEQVEKIISAASGQLSQIVEVLAFTGMRISELVWLTWEDVDFDKGFIHVRAKDTWMPKSGRPRVIPMHQRVRNLLESLPEKHRWVFSTLPSKARPNGGGRISKVHVLERLKKVLKGLGISGHLHTFRHFFASHSANNGVPAFQLVKWLGHADVGMVMHYYELHDEESLWTMKKLSMVENAKTKAVEEALHSKAV